MPKELWDPGKHCGINYIDFFQLNTLGIREKLNLCGSFCNGATCEYLVFFANKIDILVISYVLLRCFTGICLVKLRKAGLQ